MVKAGVLAGGIALLLLAILIYFVPVSQDGHTAFQDDEICTTGGANQMALAYGLTNVIQECQFAKLITFVIYGFGIIGIILVGVSAVIPQKKEEHYENEVEDDAIDILDKRYAKGEITKEEFDKMKKDLE